MKPYEILEHRADLKIRAFGKTKEELFLNMMKGMIESMNSEVRKTEKKTLQEIKIKSVDLPSLLVDFLSEILYLVQSNKEIYKVIKFQKLTERELEGKLIGQEVERFGEDIKAVTYHELDIHQKEDGNWETTVLFDI